MIGELSLAASVLAKLAQASPEVRGWVLPTLRQAMNEGVIALIQRKSDGIDFCVWTVFDQERAIATFGSNEKTESVLRHRTPAGMTSVIVRL